MPDRDVLHGSGGRVATVKTPVQEKSVRIGSLQDIILLYEIRWGGSGEVRNVRGFFNKLLRLLGRQETFHQAIQLLSQDSVICPMLCP